MKHAVPKSETVGCSAPATARPRAHAATHLLTPPHHRLARIVTTV
jgi:hypothetical protein